MTASSTPPTPFARRTNWAAGDIVWIVLVVAITVSCIVDKVLRHNAEMARIQAGAK